MREPWRASFSPRCSTCSCRRARIGIDDTIERRWGARSKARGIYRDPVRSSHGHFVKASGLRWLSLMVVVPIPWAGRRWALPFLTVLAPSERWSDARGRRHKKLTDWARQAILQAKHWLAKRRVIIVADSGFAALDLIAAVRQHVCLVTRLRLDASLFAPAPARRPAADAGGHFRDGGVVSQRRGRPRRAARVLTRDPAGKLAPQAFLATDVETTPAEILGWFVSRWRVETTFQEVRAHLGVETQRRWSDLAIARTTPALLGLFSLVTIRMHGLIETRDAAIRPRTAGWYGEPDLTFSDAIATVRRVLWCPPDLWMSRNDAETVEIPAGLLRRFTETLCYAA